MKRKLLVGLALVVTAAAGAAAMAVRPDKLDVARLNHRARHPFAAKPVGGGNRWRAEQGTEGIDDSPIDLFDHERIAATESRLDVHHGNPHLGGGHGTAERAVGVAEDDDGPRPLSGEDLRRSRDNVGDLLSRGRRSHVETVLGLGDSQLRVEDALEVVVEVLTGVDREQRPPPGQRLRQHGRLDHLRAGAIADGEPVTRPPDR